MRLFSTPKVCPECTHATSNQPSMLTSSPGWGKKMSYVIAFSADGCCDVTRRYVRNPTDHALPRLKCSEGVLMHIIREINSMRRNDMEKKQKFQLQADDMREDAELRKYIIEALAFNISRILPGGDSEKGRSRTADADAQKAAEQAAEAQRRRARADPQQQARNQRQQ